LLSKREEREADWPCLGKEGLQFSGFTCTGQAPSKITLGSLESRARILCFAFLDPRLSPPPSASPPPHTAPRLLLARSLAAHVDNPLRPTDDSQRRAWLRIREDLHHRFHDCCLCYPFGLSVCSLRLGPNAVGSDEGLCQSLSERIKEHKRYQEPKRERRRSQAETQHNVIEG
jgi:hypothetical protein